MIYTLTLNPSLDYLLYIDKLNKGKTNRTTKETIKAGGKGINVSTVLNTLDEPNKAITLLGGFVGNEIKKQLKQYKTIIIPIKENNRINIKIKATEETEINAKGPKITNKELQHLFKILEAINPEDYLIISGSTTLPNNIYSKITKYTNTKNIIIDTSDLKNAVKLKPFLIKPNLDELSKFFNKKITPKEVPTYISQIKGPKNIIVSMGKDGAYLLDENNNLYYEKALKGKVINTVGAGDTMVASFIHYYLKNKDYKKAFHNACLISSKKCFKEDFLNKKEISRFDKLHHI